MHITLDKHEADVLLEVLRNHLPELKEEVYKTENFDWRQQMKADEAVIKSLIQRLDMAVETEAPEDAEDPAQDATDEAYVFKATVVTVE
jgi:hypothetical protein